MPNEELFSGIPTLEDTQGLENYMNNAALESMGISDNVPAALQPAEQPSATPETAPQQTSVPQYTSEQVAQIVAQAQQILQNSQTQQPQQSQQMQRQPAAPTSGAYTPQQAEIIKQLIDRGVGIDRIQQALNSGNAQAATQNSVLQRLNTLEQYLQNQQYIAAQNAFIDKMSTFGNKFGLSESDLVTFGNKAMSMGINLTTVSDIETVFRAVYPEQYAIRSQRLSGAASAPIYGGASTPEAPRAAASKMEDAYVDQFLRSAMPNQYGMNTK